MTPAMPQALEKIYSNTLSQEAIYNLIIATKEKEVLFFNLPLIYGLHSVDGYDGGILPLSQFMTLQRLFLPEGDLSLDGRLREKLRFVPPNHLLSLLNTRWIITDKVFDVWIDGIFYDLQFPARLKPGQQIATDQLPDFPATAIGFVSHLQDAVELPTQAPIAAVTLTFADGQQDTITLRAGIDTAEGDYPTEAAHATQAAHDQAKIGTPWPYGAQGVDYVTTHRLSQQQPLSHISVEALLPSGQFVLRGVTLIHHPTQTSRSLTLSTEGDYRQVHSGDVKIYENLAVLPRAFVVHQTEVVDTETQAITVMQAEQFDFRQKLVRLPQGDEHVGDIIAGQPAAQDRVSIIRYEPEQVELTVTLDQPGWLVLTDTYYPGWQVSINNQPADIFRANLNFRGVAIPAGEHQVVFEYQPQSVRLGAWLTLTMMGFVGLGLLIAGRKRW